MVGFSEDLPVRIEPDAIVEAVLEVRFESPAPLPEVLIARLAELDDWKGCPQKRLPNYEIPEVIRESDRNLRYSSIFEIRADEGCRLLRIGPHVISIHRLAPYGGWGSCYPYMERAVRGLFERAERITVKRIGLRYINALTPEAHGIRGPSDIDVHIRVSERDVASRFNLAFAHPHGNDAASLVRVSTPDYYTVKSVPTASIVVDVDTATPDGREFEAADQVIQWVSGARTWKNRAFLSLLNRDTLDRLGRDE